MFLTLEIIEESLKRLKNIHPYFGMTFLVCKLNDLPVGKTKTFPINNLETEFLRKYFKPSEKSEKFYQVFKSSKPQERWLNSDYASSSLQSIRTRGDFERTFIHEKKTSLWGWNEKYVEILDEYLKKQKKRISAFYLAVWLYRERKFNSTVSAQDIVELFVKEFKLSNEDKNLFDLSVSKINIPLFGEEKITWDKLKTVIGTPENEPEESGVLEYLKISGVGPARELIFEPAERLNMLAGDNGLGKSFILDCAWWALTGNWAGVPAYPREWADEPTISFKVAGHSKTNRNLTAKYDRKSFGEDKWKLEQKRPVLPGLSIYVRVDGSFAIFDPARRESNSSSNQNAAPDTLVFTKEQIKNGFDEEVSGRKQSLINGLIHDWVTWQFSPDKSAFNRLKIVLERLSPPSVGDLGKLKPGDPMRIAGDSRLIPTIEHPYGTIPIVHASAGVQRIITLAYLLVWAWQEHQINSENIKKEPERKIVILIDEIESHLHPQWQRSILPALLLVGKDLSESEDLSLQLIIATHSPLVTGSAAPYFDYKSDKLFHIDLSDEGLFGKEAKIKEVDYVNYGRVGSWLMSDIYELEQDQTMLEAEQAIEKALRLQRQENPSKEKIKEISAELFKYLSDLDTFIPRWIAFAAKHGVEL
jgi:hypothetical protein